MTATHYDTLDERTLQRWVARTVSTVAASRGLVRQHDLAATIGWTDALLSQKMTGRSKFLAARPHRRRRHPRCRRAAVCSDDVRDTVAGPALMVVGKGGVRRRVPLPEDVATWVRGMRGFVFPSGRGHMTPNAVGVWYERHLGRNVHSLRHRYATKVYAATHDLAAVQRLLGHASVATTQVYVAVADDVLTTAAATAWHAPRLRAV